MVSIIKLTSDFCARLVIMDMYNLLMLRILHYDVSLN
jgi:hypothetical protein